jgi:hypothetical protein
VRRKPDNRLGHHAVFHGMARVRGQAVEAGQPLPSGATHEIVTREEGGRPVLKRKRSPPERLFDLVLDVVRLHHRRMNGDVIAQRADAGEVNSTPAESP